MSITETICQQAPFRSGLRIAWPFFLAPASKHAAMRQSLNRTSITRSEISSIFAEELQNRRS